MRAAARYYEERQRGIGEHYLDEFERVVTFAAEHPAAGTPLGEDLRWVLTRRFQYGVIYASVSAASRWSLSRTCGAAPLLAQPSLSGRASGLGGLTSR